MAIEQNANNKIFTVIFAIVIAGLIFTGVKLISQSNDIYNQSYEQSNLATQKLIDTSFKKTITVPVPNYASVKDGYTQALLYFTLAVGTLLIALLLPRLQTFNISPTGGLSVTLKDVQQKVENLITQANSIQADSAGPGGKKKTEELQAEVKEKINESKKGLHFTGVDNNDDPQKGRWGGLSERNKRKINAVVNESNIKDYYKITLTVNSTDSNFPLTGLVKFHLHNTFINPDPVITVQEGKAVLNLSKVYGAFTVGAEADEGKTLLELDLAELEDAPSAFKEQ